MLDPVPRPMLSISKIADLHHLLNLKGSQPELSYLAGSANALRSKSTLLMSKVLVGHELHDRMTPEQWLTVIKRHCEVETVLPTSAYRRRRTVCSDLSTRRPTSSDTKHYSSKLLTRDDPLVGLTP